MFDGIDRVNGFQNVFKRIVHRVLAGLQREPLVAHVLQGNDLGADLILRELLAGNVAVLRMIGAIQAAVDAVVGEIERRKEHNAVAVKILLDLLGQGINLLVFVLEFAGKQHGGVAMRKALAPACLFQDGVDHRSVGFVRVGIGQAVQNFLVVDEFLSFHGFRIVHVCSSFPSGAALRFPVSVVYGPRGRQRRGSRSRPSGSRRLCRFCAASSPVQSLWS